MRHLLIVTILSLCCCANGWCAEPQRFEFSEVAMGVRARIAVYAPDEARARSACRAAFDRIAELEDVMSDYRPTSELMRLCAQAGGPPVKVSDDLLAILIRSQDLARRSNGAFDATIGPLVKLWRKARKSGTLPSAEELSAARKLVGWRNVTIDRKAGTVRPALPGMQLDLGGIAKGFACDEAIRVLKREGVLSALVEMGGDIALSGAPPGKPGWEIEIGNAPEPSKRTVVLRDAGISSSGDTEQFVEIGGVRYSHIVDPRTGLGLTDRIAATVIARDCTTSDGLSTAVSILGEKKGRALVRAYPGASVYIRRATPRP